MKNPSKRNASMGYGSFAGGASAEKVPKIAEKKAMQQCRFLNNPKKKAAI